LILDEVMSALEKRTVSLSAEQAAFIDAEVGSGRFTSASEVVRAGLRALQSRGAGATLGLRDAAILQRLCRDDARIIRASETGATRAEDEAWSDAADVSGWEP
jgi:putative addiction module CopG family antidote